MTSQKRGVTFVLYSVLQPQFWLSKLSGKCMSTADTL